MAQPYPAGVDIDLDHIEVEPDDVEAAAARLEGIVHRTPVMTSRTLDGSVGGCAFLKCESFQRTGAFKIRGAYNALARLSREDRRRGVLTYSSGNHAQAAALAGRLLGIDVEIVMPQDAPPVKLVATREYGASVAIYCYPVDVKSTKRASRALTTMAPFAMASGLDALPCWARLATPCRMAASRNMENTM